MHFYISNIEQIKIKGVKAKNFFNMKVNKDDEVWVSDLQGTKAKVRIEKIDKKTRSIDLVIIKKEKLEKPGLEKILIQAKTNKAELEKMCEIAPLTDVTKVIIFQGKRSPKQKLNFNHLNKILIAACEKGDKYFKPQLYFLKSEDELNEILGTLKPTVLERNLPEDITQEENRNSSILIGPEGGWTKEEILEFQKKELPFKNMGKTNYPAWIAGYTYFSGCNFKADKPSVEIGSSEF